MADLLKRHGVDTKLQNDGVWMLFDDDIEFKLRMIPNPDYDRVLQEEKIKLTNKFLRQGPPEILVKNAVKSALAKTVVMDWKNVEFDGKKLKFSKDNLMMILNDERLGDFVCDCIMRLAGNRGRFLETNVKEDSKN